MGRETRNNSGYSLIELLVALSILALITSIAVPQVTKYLQSSREKAAKIQIENISMALEMFKIDVGRYPSQSEGLNALRQADDVAFWNGPYLRVERIPTDPWGREYVYEHDRQNSLFRLYSLGGADDDGN